MSSLDIGTLVAYTKVDTSGLSKNLASMQKQIDALQPGMEKSAQKSGTGFTRALGGVLSKGAKFSGAAMAGVLAYSLKAGFSRLNAIDQAQHKLLGLGHSAKDVKGIMNNALASVKGTAFGLGDAATVAASVVASGVKPGKDLTGVLKTVADTATIAGSSMSDMGQIFGSVAARGKLQGDDLMQLQSRGIPVLSFLAKHYGTTAKAASQMVSQGKVSFKDFEQAMHQNLGGAAMQSGKTVQGAFANLKASLGRIGANLLSGVFSKLPGFLEGLTKKLGPVEDKASEVGRKIGKSLKKLGPSLKSILGSAFKMLGKVVPPVAKALGKVADVGLKVAAWILKHKSATIILGTVIAGLTGIVIAYDAAMGVAAAGGMMKWLKSTKLITGVTKVWTAVQWAMNAAMEANPIMLIVTALVALGVALVVAYKKSATFRNIVNGAFQGVKKVALGVFNWFRNAISAVVGFIRNHWKLLVGIFGGPIAAVVVLVTSHWKAIKTKTKDAIGKVVGFVKAIPRKFADGLSTLRSKIVSIFKGAMNAGKDKVQNIGGKIVDWIQGVPGKIGALGSKFGTAGRKLLQKFIDGMENAAGIISGIAGNVWKAVKGLLNGAITKINNALDFKISIPGPDIHVNVPDIPKLKTGGRVGANSPRMAWIGDANEPESVLRDSQLRVLMEAAAKQGAAAAGGHHDGGRSVPLIGNVTQAPGESAENLAERLWFITQKRA